MVPNLPNLISEVDLFVVLLDLSNLVERLHNIFAKYSLRIFIGIFFPNNSKNFSNVIIS